MFILLLYCSVLCQCFTQTDLVSRPLLLLLLPGQFLQHLLPLLFLLLHYLEKVSEYKGDT